MAMRERWKLIYDSKNDKHEYPKTKNLYNYLPVREAGRCLFEC
jgi:hypothetical protein